ncbi:hypothetical protein GCM10022389_09170 [Flavobacterium cheonanense]|uniref:Lipoprotein n=1 Tax=Flavobacterium cheonanense TaxID=706183 RepID=A0ABP7VG68_9FLAO
MVEGDVVENKVFYINYKLMRLVFNVFLILIFICCISCDTPYVLFVENNTNKDVEVFVKSKIKINFDSLRHSERKISRKEVSLFNLRKTESLNFIHKSKIKKIDSLSYSLIIKSGTTSIIGPNPLKNPFETIHYYNSKKKIYFSSSKSDSTEIFYPNRTILEIK